MKLKARVLNQVEVFYVSQVITAPQPELSLLKDLVFLMCLQQYSSLSFVKGSKLTKQITQTRL